MQRTFVSQNIGVRVQGLGRLYRGYLGGFTGVI